MSILFMVDRGSFLKRANLSPENTNDNYNHLDQLGPDPTRITKYPDDWIAMKTNNVSYQKTGNSLINVQITIYKVNCKLHNNKLEPITVKQNYSTVLYFTYLQ